MRATTRKFYGHFHCRPFFADELFIDLGPRSSDLLDRIRLVRRFDKNDTVVAAGDLPDCVFIHSSGQARMTIANGINHVTDLRLVKRNEIIGLNEMFANSFCQMNVETITSCVFDCLPKKEFLRFLNENPPVCFRLLSLFGNEVQASHERFAGSRF